MSHLQRILESPAHFADGGVEVGVLDDRTEGK